MAPRQSPLPPHPPRRITHVSLQESSAGLQSGCRADLQVRTREPNPSHVIPSESPKRRVVRSEAAFAPNSLCRVGARLCSHTVFFASFLWSQALFPHAWANLPCRPVLLLFWVPLFTQIRPRWVFLIDECDFLFASPSFQLLLALHGLINLSESFKPDQSVAVVFRGETVVHLQSMLKNPFPEVPGHADI